MSELARQTQPTSKPSMDADASIKLIGNYQLKNTTGLPEAPSLSHERVKKLLGGPGLVNLYQKCPTEEHTEKREAFINELAKNLQLLPISKEIGKDRINLADLLGSSYAVSLYTAAIKEERNSKNFRDAVLLESTKTYKTKTKWNKRMILWVAGPSSSGKSYATDAVIREMIGTMDHHTDPTLDEQSKLDAENHVVTIDGGIAREMSQIRQLVLQAALRLGYTGIQDLETNTETIKLKTEIRDAALANGNPVHLSLAIPSTFTNSKYLDDMEGYAKRRDSTQVFSEVTGDKSFKKTVGFLGNTRAWLSGKIVKEQRNTPIIMNNRNIGCESKKYEGFWFALGVSRSAAAREKYKKLHPENPICYTVTNDLVYLIKNNAGNWQECNSINEVNHPSSVKTTRRMWEAFQNAPKQDLQEWLKIQPSSGPIIKNTSNLQRPRENAWRDTPATTLPFSAHISPKPNHPHPIFNDYDSTWQNFNNAATHWFKQKYNLQPFPQVNSSNILTFPIPNCQVVVQRIASTPTLAQEYTIKAEKNPVLTEAVAAIIELTKKVIDVIKDTNEKPITIEMTGGSLQNIKQVLEWLNSETKYKNLIQLHIAEETMNQVPEVLSQHPPILPLRRSLTSPSLQSLAETSIPIIPQPIIQSVTPRKFTPPNS